MHFSKEHKRKISEALRGMHFSETHKRNISEAMQNMTDETKQRMSEARKGIHLSEETKQKMSDNHADFRGEKSGMWRGGISFEPYCIKFNNEFKERVREYFNRCCYVCGKNEIENKQRLSIHHVLYNKDTCCDDSLPLFVPLCKSCHMHTNGNREFWQEFFEISLSYLTNNKCYLSKEEMKKCLK